MMDRDSRLKTLLPNLSPKTQAIRVGMERTHEREHSEPIYATSSFVFPNAETMCDAFVNNSGLSTYARIDNPTVDGFCKRLAVMENTESCEATASGMGAILSTVIAYCRSGDRILVSTGVFGATMILFQKYFAKLGIKIDIVPTRDLKAWEKALEKRPKLAYCETPSNPTIEVIDICSLSEMCRQIGCLLVVDNCFMTPALQRPLELGADLVIHSATKYLDGQGRVLGGAVLGSKALVEPITAFIRSGGVTMSAFNAWIFLKGLETLELRMKVHSEHALKLALWLQAQPQVALVNYAGLKTHPQAGLIRSQMQAGGGVLSFELKDGDREDVWKFLNATCLMSLTANLGDLKTTICHPATTTHGRLSNDELKVMGITDNLVRIAVGHEATSDLIADCERGFAVL